MSPAHLREMHGIRIMQRKHPLIRLLGREGSAPSLHGTQVWRSSFMLMEYLAEHPIARGQRVMELGCGWGLLGIYCAKQFSAEVLLTDADARVFPYADRHAELNEVRVRTKQVRFDGISESCLRDHDTLVGADICFWPELRTQLRGLIRRALSFGVARILLGDPGRPTFFRLAADCQRDFGARLLPRAIAGRVKSSGHVLIIEPHEVGRANRPSPASAAQ